MRKIIRTDGTETVLDGPQSMTKLRQAIGAEDLDSVPLRHLGRPLQVMFCDDNGHDLGKPVNYRATELYHANCRPNTLHEIVGDVAIVPDDDFFEDMGLDPPATHS